MRLKATSVKALKDTAASIRLAVEALEECTSSDEVRKLQAENTRLRMDVKVLKCQVAELAKEQQLLFQVQFKSPPARRTTRSDDQSRKKRARGF